MGTCKISRALRENFSKKPNRGWFLSGAMFFQLKTAKSKMLI